MAPRPVLLFADWPEPAVGETAQETAVAAVNDNLELRAWIRAVLGTPPRLEVLLLEQVDDRLLDRLENFGAIVIVRRDEHPIPGEERLEALLSDCGPARPILLRPELDPVRQPANKRGGG